VSSSNVAVGVARVGGRRAPVFFRRGARVARQDAVYPSVYSTFPPPLLQAVRSASVLSGQHLGALAIRSREEGTKSVLAARDLLKDPTKSQLEGAYVAGLDAPFLRADLIRTRPALRYARITPGLFTIASLPGGAALVAGS